jgi:hypothetical protein
LDQVRLYLEPPPAPYEQIALIGASSGRSLALTSDAKAEIVIRRLREEAAKLGANGVLLYGISDEATIFLGTDIGTDHQGPRGTIDLGIGGGGFWHRQSGRGVAIYLTPDLNQHASQ